MDKQIITFKPPKQEDAQTKMGEEEEKSWLQGLTDEELELATICRTLCNRGRPRGEILQKLRVEASRKESSPDNSEPTPHIDDESKTNDAQDRTEYAEELSRIYSRQSKPNSIYN